MELKVKKLHEDAELPTYGTPGAACFDLYAAHNGEIGSFVAGTVDIGLAFEVPEGHVMLIFSRSGHGFKHGVTLANSVGVIDSDYRNSVKVGLRNNSPFRFDFNVGDRIAQALILPIQQVSFVLADELSSTVRGFGGLGSTGK